MSAGSGAGASLTRLTESAQCAYAAIAFGLGRSIKNNDVMDSTIFKIWNYSAKLLLKT